jgi:seryl-tRNA synthetase
MACFTSLRPSAELYRAEAVIRQANARAKMLERQRQQSAEIRRQQQLQQQQQQQTLPPCAATTTTTTTAAEAVEKAEKEKESRLAARLLNFRAQVAKELQVCYRVEVNILVDFSLQDTLPPPPRHPTCRTNRSLR